MSIETTQEKATYLVQADGTLAPNKAGEELQACYQRVQAEQEALDSSWAGAVLARLFLKHVWLDAMTLSFIVRAEYDDCGGYGRCIQSQVHAVRAVAQHSLPEHLFPGGTFHQDSAQRVLEAEIDGDETDLYASLSATPHGFDDLDVTLERRLIAALLLKSPIDGSAAFKAWELARSVAA
jgi:hypothetical protein